MKLDLSSCCLAVFCAAFLCGAGIAAEPDTITYADISTAVTVKKAAPRPWDVPRPANFFQLAGSADEQLCQATLDVFNEAGKYRETGQHDGAYAMQWLLDNSHQIEFHNLELDPAGESGTGHILFRPLLEYASVDLDSDGHDEHVYRLTANVSSQWYQKLMVTPDSLQSQPALLQDYRADCASKETAGKCDAPAYLIKHALLARANKHPAQEWWFTRRDVLAYVIADTASRQLIYPQSPRQPVKNLPARNRVYWSLYRIESVIAAVAAPTAGFAPPELLVFVPAKEKASSLQCIITPIAWDR